VTDGVFSCVNFARVKAPGGYYLMRNSG